MAGEPARALVTDQITSSSAIPDEDDPRRAMALTAAVAAAIPAAIEGVLNGAVRRNELSLVVKHRLQTELITALDKATKDACAPFTMGGAMRDDGERGAAGRGGAGTPVGAAEGAVGLLLFFADMVFSRGLHVALSLSTDIL